MNRVIKIKKVKVDADVIDISVPKARCYYTASGHLVHNSRPDIEKCLIDLGIDTGERTKTGKMKTSAAVLEKMTDPVAQRIIRRSQLAKAKGSYIEKMTKQDWTRFNFLIYRTTTGRFASSNSDKSGYFLNFNAQNVTKPTPAFYNAERSSDPDAADSFFGWTFTMVEKPEDADFLVEGFSPKLNVRRAIAVPSPDWYFGSIDFEQEELMLAAMFSREPVLMKAFRAFEDSHKAVALEMFGAANYNKAARKKGKIANFSLLYGGNAGTLAGSSGLPYSECEDLYDAYWKSLHVLKNWKKAEIRKAYANHGYVYTAYGRPRRLRYYLRSSKQATRRFGERSVASHIIQGTSGDIMRICLCKFFNNIWPQYGGNSGMRFVNAVHDEIDFVVRREKAHQAFKDVRAMMAIRPPNCELALRTSLEVGDSYGNMFPFELNEETDEYVPVAA